MSLMYSRTPKMAVLRSYSADHALVDLDGYVQFVGVEAGGNPRPHRLERVGVLGPPHGAVVALPVAFADVVADGVAEHVVQRLILADVAALFADDNDHLTLVLQLFGGVGGHHNRVAVAGESVDRAIAHVGLLGQVGFLAAHLGGPR